MLYLTIMTDSLIIHGIINEMIDKVEQTNKNDILHRVIRRSDDLTKSIYINRYYFTTLFICMIVFYMKQKTSSLYKNVYLFTNLIGSYVFMIIWGWYVHFISHNISFTEIYTYLLDNTHNWIDKMILFIFKYTIDFHDLVHHNTSVNKYSVFLIIECIQNIVSQGLWFFLFNIDKVINKYIILLWVCTYASVHLINYNISYIKNCHKEHHINYKTNYGIDYMDIIMGTKYDTKKIENINHYSINLIVITIILYIWG